MRKVISTNNAPAAIGPYVQAIANGDLLFTSGQLGIDPKTSKLEDGVEAQAKRSMQNLENILKENGMTYDNVVKTTIFVKDLEDYAIINEVYGKAFGDKAPARSCVQVAKLPLDGLVEIELIAVK